jgi:hypothetical protein
VGSAHANSIQQSEDHSLARSLGLVVTARIRTNAAGAALATLAALDQMPRTTQQLLSLFE